MIGVHRLNLNLSNFIFHLFIFILSQGGSIIGVMLRVIGIITKHREHDLPRLHLIKVVTVCKAIGVTVIPVPETLTGVVQKRVGTWKDTFILSLVSRVGTTVLNSLPLHNSNPSLLFPSRRRGGNRHRR